VLAALVGIGVSLAAWAFLELVHQLQTLVFTDLPDDLGYSGVPAWYYVIVLGLAGLIAAFAIVRLPGEGGHIPAKGLKIGGPPVQPIEVPGILLAAFATIGLGVVLGPEAPLIAMGAGLGVMAIRALRRDAPEEIQAVMAASGSIAAVSLLFGSPIIAAVLLLEALGLDRKKLPLVLLPGLLAAGIGSLISIGLGSLTGLNTSDYSIGALTLPAFPRPDIADFAWTIPLALVVALVTFVVMRLGLLSLDVLRRRPFFLLPAAGVVIALLAAAFHGMTDKSAEMVLFSGQDQLPGLITEAGSWSIGALLLVVAVKGLAWGISLGGFRGGPTFPAMFIGAALGIVASHLPGMDMTGAVGVGLAAGVVSVLRLPLTAVILGVLLTSQSGAGTEPLIIVGVVVAYFVTVALGRAFGEAEDPNSEPAPAPA
jgi:H+/Cl- antiporter ClcA